MTFNLSRSAVPYYSVPQPLFNVLPTQNQKGFIIVVCWGECMIFCRHSGETGYMTWSLHQRRMVFTEQYISTTQNHQCGIDPEY